LFDSAGKTVELQAPTEADAVMWIKALLSRGVKVVCAFLSPSA
jgi:hypothetical protein